MRLQRKPQSLRLNVLRGWESLEARRVLAVVDPLGDATQDLAFADVRSVGENLDIIVKFAPGGFDLNKSNIAISFDTDQNPATGSPGIDAANSDSTFIGTEFVLSLRDTDRFHAKLYEFMGPPNDFSFRGDFPVEHIEDGVRMFVPRAALGGDDGVLNYKVTSAEQLTDTGSTGVLDVMPNKGLPAATSVWVPGTGNPVNDPAGDAYPDVVSAKVRKIAGELDITILFAPGTLDLNISNVQISFDTDQNPWTGHPGIAASGTVDSELLGAEFILDISSPDRTIAKISKYTGPPINTFAFTDAVPVMHFMDGLRMRFPVEFIGDDGILNYKVTTSEQLSPSGSSGLRDVIPDLQLPAATSICTVAGDVNADGTFDSNDLIEMLATAKYETKRRASYEEGDLNGDGIFSTDDLIYALAEATYQASPIRDLAADRLEFSILSQTTPFRGEVEIRGFVKNVGTLDYMSTPGQQAAYLYEQYLGGQAQLVATMPFVNLTPGEEVPVSYVRSWDSSSPNEGEFPPTYRLLVAYDPDIYLDGNLLNDDANSANNVLNRSGSDINDMFRT